ncbi:hypothetical protein ASE01_14370 [Nocardioides sp. Root190]|uniref:hypothetical protein n=1 Tax=Nocardioides sp. Root190 TaxID=1736488 RepID=UPI0006F2DA97|nr:hypothetical protein [Nocardioides sp. Root190]KRB76197.1 hypothetical protein ASE01_14370 [Nocardioides sp. Root190]
MTERVRVTGPPRHTIAGRTSSRLGDVHEQTELGDVYLRSLLREQLGLALTVLVTITLVLGSLPLVFHLWPGLADVDVAGLPVVWIGLGVLVYPFLLLLGWRYVRSVERNERDFAELVKGSGSAPRDGEE